MITRLRLSFLLAVIAPAYLAIGITLIVQPSRFDNTPSYGALLELLSQTVWGGIYIAVAVALGATTVTGTWRYGRFLTVAAHTAAIALTAAWLAAFVVRWFTDSGTTIVNCVSWSVYLSLLIRSALQLDNTRNLAP